MKYKALFLDLDNTLCDTKNASHKAVKILDKKLVSHFDHHLNGIAESFWQHIIKTPEGQEWKIHKGENEEHYRSRLLKQVCLKEANFNMSPSDATYFCQYFFKARTNHFGFFQGVPELLVKLRKDYTLVLITNGPLFSQEPKVEKVNIKSYVDHVILAGAYPEQKPHPSIFKLACTKANCSTEEALHVGDSYSADIIGANQSGIDSVWINSSHNDNDNNSKATYSLTKFTELDQLLKKINLATL